MVDRNLSQHDEYFILTTYSYVLLFFFFRLMKNSERLFRGFLPSSVTKLLHNFIAYNLEMCARGTESRAIRSMDRWTRENERERERERTRTIHGYGHVAVVTHERTAETRLVEFTERFMGARARPRSTHGPRIEATPLFSMAHRLVTACPVAPSRTASRRIASRPSSTTRSVFLKEDGQHEERESESP